MQIREVLTVLFLAVADWKDWKKKEISLFLTGCFGILGIGFSIYAGRSLQDWMIPTGVSLIMLAAAGYAGILLFICKKGRKTEIPLVPFLLLGYLGGFLL